MSDGSTYLETNSTRFSCRDKFFWSFRPDALGAPFVPLDRLELPFFCTFSEGFEEEGAVVFRAGKEKDPSAIWSKSSATGGSRDFHISDMPSKFLMSFVNTFLFS